MTTKRELAELAAKARAVALMPGISAAEARLRTVAIFESQGYLPGARHGPAAIAVPDQSARTGSRDAPPFTGIPRPDGHAAGTSWPYPSRPGSGDR